MDELREQMEAAWDVEEKRLAAEMPEPEAPETQETSPVDEPAKEPAKDDLRGDIEKGATPEKEAAPSMADTQKDDPEPKTESQKAPASWSAKGRESWSKLPSEAQNEVLKREKEINKVLQESATARRAISELSQVLGPHAQRLQAAGVQSPMQAIGVLLQTEGKLRSNDQTTKAHTIAGLIREYGVDIQTLDNVLSNNPIPQKQRPNADIDALLNERLAPFTQFISQQQQYAAMQAERSKAEANQSVAEFSQSAEFINDVRLDMADLMDMAAARGIQMTLQQAYDKACAIHPDVSKIMAERAKQQQMMGTTAQAQAKRNAAVSITGQQRGTTTPAANSLRESIEQAWNESLGA